MDICFEGTGNCVFLQFLFCEKEEVVFRLKIGRPQLICVHMPFDVGKDVNGIGEGADMENLDLEAAFDFMDSFLLAQPLVDAGKFIEAGKQTVIRSFLEKEGICAADDQQGAVYDLSLFQCAAERDCIRLVVKMCEACFLEGAVVAMGWLVGAADGCAQLHQCLIEVGDEAGASIHSLCDTGIKGFLEDGCNLFFDGIFADIVGDGKASCHDA